MDKQELLKKIEKKELQRLGDMSSSQFFNEYCEWFMLTDEDIKEAKTYTKSSWLNTYMEDFMAWRGQDSVEELQEYLKMNYENIKKR